MKYLNRSLGALILFCIAIRIAAWLITSIWPFIVIIAVVLVLYRLMSGESFRR